MDETNELTLSVLVPAFNEEGSIAKVVHKVLALPYSLEVVVVNDGSTDGTATVIESLADADARVRYFEQPQNMGKTAAIARAIQESRGAILIVQDADLEYDPEEIPDVIEPILNDVADVVYGSRFLVKRAARVLYYYHYLANKFLTFLSNLLTNRNMSDIETCYKAFRREVLKPVSLTSRGFGMEVELTALVCRTQARTYEVPISYYGRTYEEGKKIGWRDGVVAIWYILLFNLISPWTATVKEYVREVNQRLAARR